MSFLENTQESLGTGYIYKMAEEGAAFCGNIWWSTNKGHLKVGPNKLLSSCEKMTALGDCQDFLET